MKLLQVVLALSFAVTAPTSFPATFTVTTNASSGAGSLRQAMIDANANPGPDTIEFAIGSGPQTIDVSAPYLLPAIDDPVVIDATTQPGYVDAPMIRLVQSAERYDLTVNVGPSTIRGLKFDGPGYLRLSVSGGGNRLAGNEFTGYWVFVRGDANTIGGTAVGDGNVFHMGLWLEGSSHNIVQGNTFLNPYVGYGIKIVGGIQNQIGGTGQGAGNTIRSCAMIGIDISGDGNVVRGNTVSDNGDGIRVAHTGNMIGGLDPGAGNVIAQNGGPGVRVLAPGNAILSNAIYGNRDPAILFMIANPLQARVCSITHNAGATRVSGELSGGTSGGTYRIQLFGNATACDAETYLGDGVVTADASGLASWQFDVSPTTSNVISATVTNSANTTSALSACTLTCRRIPSDFNGDGRSDLFWRNPQTGQNTIWFMSGRSIIGGYDLPNVPASYSLHLGDFNGDGRTDLYWWNPTARDGTVWLMNGSSFTGAGDSMNRSTKGAGWELLVGDFTGDGRADLFWRELATGYQELWAGLPFVLTGKAPQVSSTPGWERRAAQVGGSSADDVMWRFPPDGQGSFWFMNGAVPASGANLWPVGADWTPSLADVNGDDHADILWRHNTTGELTFWFMDGGTIIGGGGMFADVPAPRLLYRGDFNGDGKIDILWRNPPDGENAMWFLDGRRIIGGGNAPPVNVAGWELVGQR